MQIILNSIQSPNYSPIAPEGFPAPHVTEEETAAERMMGPRFAVNAWWTIAANLIKRVCL